MTAQVCEELKNSEEVKADTRKKLTEEWAQKILGYWKWKRMHFEFWEKYLSWLKSAPLPDDEKMLLPRGKTVDGSPTGEPDERHLV